MHVVVFVDLEEQVEPVVNEGSSLVGAAKNSAFSRFHSWTRRTCRWSKGDSTRPSCRDELGKIKRRERRGRKERGKRRKSFLRLMRWIDSSRVFLEGNVWNHQDQFGGSSLGNFWQAHFDSFYGLSWRTLPICVLLRPPGLTIFAGRAFSDELFIP